MDSELIDDFNIDDIRFLIRATFDSVYIIEYIKLNGYELNGYELYDIDDYNRNMDHIKIMMNKKWFVENLTNEELNRINNIL